jgi:hypothetical protein
MQHNAPQMQRFLHVMQRAAIPVGAAAGCDLLILPFKNQGQKIAACGSSYRGLASAFAL